MTVTLFIVGVLVTFGTFALIMGATSRSKFWVDFWFTAGSVTLAILIAIYLIANVVRLT